MNYILKSAGLIIVVTAIMIFLLSLSSSMIDDLSNSEEHSETPEIGKRNTDIEIMSYLNKLPDADETERVKSLSGVNPYYYIVLFLVPLSFSLLGIFKAKNISNGEIISFGLYLTLALSLLYNTFIMLSFSSWGFHNVFDILVNGVTIGAVSSLYSVTLRSVLEFIEIIKEEGISLAEVIVENIRTPKIRLALSYAGSWMFFSLLSTLFLLARLIV